MGKEAAAAGTAAEGGGALTPPPPSSSLDTSYGAHLTKGQFIKLTIALCMGTIVEWMDFSIFSQLSTVITALFFPPDNPAIAEISFWGVYAIGYIARPLGAIIFGHVGDTHGRRLTLLVSVLLITLPTLLIGCLPTYAMIGLAAPILMALLRFVQGLAVGGEFGSAITYLYEIAPARHKGLIASMGQMAVSPGMALGILLCQAVLYGCTHDQLMLWGWRVPFLLTVFTTPLALYLRMHMPEPYEFLKDRKTMVAQRVASTAALRVARSFSRQHSLAGAPGSTTGSSRAHVLRSLSSLRSSSSMLRQQQHTLATTAGAEAGAAGGPPAGRQLSVRQLSQRLQRSVSITEDGRVVSDAGWTHGDQQHLQQQQQQANSKLLVGEEGPVGCEQAFQEEVEQLSSVIKTHIPLAVLFREHWSGVLLQFLLEACYGTVFYTAFTMVPSYMQKELHIPAMNTLWSLLIGLALFAVLVPAAGHWIGDTKIPKVWALMAVTGVFAVAAMPVFVVFGSASGHTVGLWLLLPLTLGLTGVMGGIMTTIGPSIYPAAVRATGYNLGHNLAMSLFGGLCPLIISALAVAVHPPTMAAGLVVVMTALITFVAGVALVKVLPATNAPVPAGAIAAYQQQQEHQEQQRREAQRMQEVVTLAGGGEH